MNICQFGRYIFCLMVLLVVHDLFAIPVTFEFTGVVTQSDLTEFAGNDTLSGQLTFESGTVDSDAAPNTGHYIPAVTNYSFLFSGGYSGALDTGGRLTDILVSNDDPFDVFSVVANVNGDIVGGFVPEISTTNFVTNRTPSALILSESLPWTPPDMNLADITSGALRFSGGHFVHYEITSFTLGGQVCDFSGDLHCGVDDINLMFQQGDLVAGVSVSGGNVFDLNHDLSINAADIDLWLNTAATANGWNSPYRRGDTDDLDAVQGLDDRDVDITDFDILVTHFNPTGGASTIGNWHLGNFDGDSDVDITDFNFLSANFSPASYVGSDVETVPEPAGFALIVAAGCLLVLRSCLR